MTAESQPETSTRVADPFRFVQDVSSVVQRRNGSVLARGLILKSDHYASGRALDLDFNLMGAPNFRAASTQLKVYATAQPKLNGLRTILSILSCFPHAESPQKAVWVSTREEPQLYVGGRPFVLRDAEQPFEGISLTDRGDHLNEIEQRLKQDVLKEGKRYGGCILLHEELDSGRLVANWVAADEIRTPLELFEQIKKEGYLVDYHRIPIAHEQDPEVNYLDAYAQLITSTSTDTTLIFNCGMGFVRSTYASCVALILRRRQRILAGEKDPFWSSEREKKKSISISSPHAQRVFEQADVLQTRSKSLLLLMGLLNKDLSFHSDGHLITTLTAHPKVLDDLIHAIQGRYDIILQLLATLETGLNSKSLVDHLIDDCDATINLRHTILNQRLRYASSTVPPKQKPEMFRRGLKALERYFFLIAFAAFTEQSQDLSDCNFGKWIKGRDEIFNMIQRMRRSTKDLRMFSPAQDLSVLSRAEIGKSSSAAQRFQHALKEGSELAGHEFATLLVSNRSGITLRSGTILKRDIWPYEIKSNRKEEEGSQQERIRGAFNFRQIPDSNLFALSQPSETGISGVVARIREQLPGVTWINLREEPLCYVNNHCYVLREERMSLRNLRNFAGISSSRLELLEERLKADIVNELETFDGKLLLHVEQDDGSIVPVWERSRQSDIRTLKELMDEQADDQTFRFIRLPMTAERKPDFADTQEIIEIVKAHEAAGTDRAVVVNCQLGAGRSTMVLLIIMLTQNWLRSGPHANILKRGHERPYSFQIINNLLRVVRNGQEVKSTVDFFLEKTSTHLDLTDSILQYRADAENATAAEQPILIAKGLLNLRRYWWLLLLTIYFQDMPPSSNVTFQQWVEGRPVFKTLEQEFNGASLHALTPLGARVAHVSQSDKMQEVIATRKGRILTAQTILKSDFFSGLQKKNLPEQIDGAPNYRRIRVADKPTISIFGLGMPTVNGLREALAAMRGQDGGSARIAWTSMREEPVLYIAGRPHVLRQCDEPFENIVTTGVRAQTVEKMEDQLKADVLDELEQNGGQVLLHDETDLGDGFEVVGEWVTVSPEDVLTAKEVFAQLQNEFSNIDYMRVPVTDEQAPLPGVFSLLEERVLTAIESTKGSNGANHIGLVFNCQMGRGRTTTAQIAAALVVQILVIGGTPMPPLTPLDDASKQAFARVSWDSEGENRFLDGEYKAILQLVGVLRHGKAAKRLADYAIDQMDSIQNLRKAVYDFKLRVDAADDGSEKANKLLRVGSNYLFRYGLLIAFADYLLIRAEEQGCSQPSQGYPSFSDYYTSHREIARVLARKSFD